MLDWEMEALVVLLVSNLTSGLKEEQSFSVYGFFLNIAQESQRIVEQPAFETFKAIQNLSQA